VRGANPFHRKERHRFLRILWFVKATYGRNKDSRRGINGKQSRKTVETPSKRLFPEEWKEGWKQLEERVRQQPAPHLLMALAIGYLLQIIPFRSLLVLAGKLCLMLARPVLFLFCAFQLAKYMGKATSSDLVSEWFDLLAKTVRRRPRCLLVCWRRQNTTKGLSVSSSAKPFHGFAQARNQSRAELLSLYFIDTRERLEPFDSQIEPKNGRKRVEGYRRVFWYFDFIIHRRKARVFDPVVDLEIGIDTLFLFWGRLLFRSRLWGSAQETEIYVR
jgi:hypothetical protein